MKRFVLILTLLLSLTAQAYAQVVHVPDPNLRAALREALNIPENSAITQDAMLQLTRFHVQALGIADLTGLEFARNLRDLHFGRNPISDITPVGTLTNLIALRAYHCEIDDVSPLADLIKLEFLELYGNRIWDVEPLAKLNQLKYLALHGNLITDHSPLDGLALEQFIHDLETVCDMPPLPLAPRIENRNYPSLITGWTARATWPSYDLIFCCPRFDTQLRETANGFQIRTHHPSWDEPIAVRDAYLQKNPTMVFLAGVSVKWNHLDTFPEDSPFWLRDENGEIMPAWDMGLMNLNDPGWQQWVIDRAAAIDKCGLYDGIFIDGWAEYATKRNGTFPGQIAILKGIREQVRDNFLIMVNTNAHESPASAPYINGLFMETVFPYHERRPDVIERRLTKIENTLKWAETTVREPRINAVEGRHDYNEPLDSPRNTQWMRAITTLSLTFSNGYSVFPNQKGKHWYNFWDADLGRPVGNTLQLYEDRPGLYIREFTNGWAVYNHSGAAQIVTLPEEVRSAATGISNTEHAVLDLDGDIFLKVEVSVPGDLNGDGVVNILDLIIVAQAMGTDKREADVNGDDVINVMDLVFVANQF